MPALISTEFTGNVAWLGRVAKRQTNMRSHADTSVAASFAGFDGEDHSGLTRPSCARVRAQYPVGTEIRNTRQLSIVSSEELELIATAMGLPRIEPEWLGASMVLEGIPDFTLIPPSSRLQIADDVTLVVDMENRPCQFPAKEIEKETPGFGKLFKQASHNRRGVVAWVEKEGAITIGDKVRLHIPCQPTWPHYGVATAAK